MITPVLPGLEYLMFFVVIVTTNLAKKLNVQSQENICYYIFLYNLLKNLIDCPKPLAKIPIYTTNHTHC